MTSKVSEPTKPLVTAKGDLYVNGNPDTFKPLYKVMIGDILTDACGAMEIRGAGCLVRTFTRRGDQIAEALTFVPGVKVVEEDGELKLQNANP